MSDVFDRTKPRTNSGPRPSFIRQVGILAGGTVMAQGMLLAASPLLTRLYNPEDFGVLAAFAAVTGVFAVVAGLRYELAIPVDEKPHDAAHVLVLSVLVTLTVTALTGIAVATLGQRTLEFAPVLAPYVWFIPLSTLAIGVYQALSYWAIRTRAFGLITSTKLTQSVLAIGAQVSVGVAVPSPIGLILGQVVGRSAGVLLLARHAIVSFRTIGARIEMSRLRSVAMRHAKFPLYSTWTALANSLGREAPPLLLLTLFGATTAGQYALGARVLHAPLTLVGNAVGQVFFARAGDAARTGNLPDLVRSIVERLLHIGVPALVIVALSAPELFAFAFGDPWRTAGTYSQWFTPWLALVFVTSPLSTLPSILGRQRPELVFQVVLLTTRVGALAVGSALGGSVTAIALFSLTSAANWFGFLLWTFRIAGQTTQSTLRILASVARVTIAIAVPAVAGKALGTIYMMDLHTLLGAAASLVLAILHLVLVLRRPMTTP